MGGQQQGTEITTDVPQVETHATGLALKTVEAHSMSSSNLHFFCAWYCPYAQRVWIALEVKGLDYRYIEINPYAKPKELLDINPRGLVPAVKHGNTNLLESTIILEYLDEAFPSSPQLLPPIPHSGGENEIQVAAAARANVRVWANHVDKKICPAFFKLLMTQDAEGQAEAAKNLEESVKEFAEGGLLKSNPAGRFFLPSDHLSYVDVMLAPFALRFLIVLPHYRSFSFPSPSTSPVWARWHKWVEAVKNHPSVAKTVSEDVQYVLSYRRYAEGTAKSQVADAVRAGKALP
ncbi:hypothetical protein HK104_002829 [Borealophlyctis nickersoniae]|nr:hypothetical protein HK104_002829 [Borealophlyctis nickersoniae]